MRVTAYTDGAASGNPGPGGYGAVLEAGKHRRELWGGYRRTTNNRMELMAVIVALEALKLPGMEVTVVSDSKYVVDAVEQGWLFDWEKRASPRRRTPTCGNASWPSTANTRCASNGSAVTTDIRRTNCATGSPWPHANNRACPPTRPTNGRVKTSSANSSAPGTERTDPLPWRTA